MNDNIHNENDEAELLASILADAKKVNKSVDPAPVLKPATVEPEIVEQPITAEMTDGVAELDSSDDDLLLESILEDAQKVSGKTPKLPSEKKVDKEIAPEKEVKKDETDSGFAGLSLGNKTSSAPKLNPKFQVNNNASQNGASGADVTDFEDGTNHSTKKLPTRAPQGGRRQINPMFNVSKSTPKRGKLPLVKTPNAGVDNSVESDVNKVVDKSVETGDNDVFSGLNLGSNKGLPQGIPTPVDKSVDEEANNELSSPSPKSNRSKLPTIYGNDSQENDNLVSTEKQSLPIVNEGVDKPVDSGSEKALKDDLRGDPLSINRPVSNPVDNPVDNLPNEGVDKPVDNLLPSPKKTTTEDKKETSSQGGRERWLPDANAGLSRGFKPFLGGENSQGKRVRDAARKKVAESASEEGLIVEPDDLPVFRKPRSNEPETVTGKGVGEVSKPFAEDSEDAVESIKETPPATPQRTVGRAYQPRYREGDNIEDIVPLGRQGNRVDNVDVGEWTEDSRGTSAGLQGDIEIAERKHVPKGMKLTNNDIIMLRFLARYRYAYIDVLARLVDKDPRGLGRRLNILNNHGYLRKEIITDRQGVWTNRRAGNAVVDMNFPDIKKGDISAMQIAHTIGVANLAAEFEREAGGKDFLGEGKGVPGWLPPKERWKYGIWGYEDKKGGKTHGYMTFSEREIRNGQMRNKGLRTAEEMRGLIHNAIMDPTAPEMGEGQEWLFPLYGAGNAGGDHIPDLVVLRPRDEQGRTRHAAIELELGVKKAAEWVRILRQYRDKGEMYDKIYYFTHKKDVQRGLLMADENVGLGDRLVIRRYEPKNRSMPFWG